MVFEGGCQKPLFFTGKMLRVKHRGNRRTLRGRPYGLSDGRRFLGLGSCFSVTRQVDTGYSNVIVPMLRNFNETATWLGFQSPKVHTIFKTFFRNTPGGAGGKIEQFA